MSEFPARFTPAITTETEEYWAGCRRHELLLQRCADCRAWQFYPRLMCVSCSGRNLQWSRASGGGHVASYTIVRRAVSDAYAPMVPYVVALVRLDEGPTMMSHVVACDVDSVRIGMSLDVVFEDWPEGVTIPSFRPRVNQPAQSAGP